MLLLLIAFSIVSCEDNEINEFAMQAKIGDRLYTSTEARAFFDEDGGFIIEGLTQTESLTLRLTRLEEGNFNFGSGFRNTATFEDRDGNIYKTKPEGSGVVTISEVNQTNRTISGIFNFRAMLTGIDTIYVSKGVLYNIPFAAGIPNDPANAGTLSAKVNGETFTPTVVTAMQAGNSVTIIGSKITSTISITVPSNVEVGEYLLPVTGYNAEFQNEAGPQATSDGTISITEHNVGSGIIKGTFTFSTDQSEITEGQFEVVY